MSIKPCREAVIAEAPRRLDNPEKAEHAITLVALFRAERRQVHEALGAAALLADSLDEGDSLRIVPPLCAFERQCLAAIATARRTTWCRVG